MVTLSSGGHRLIHEFSVCFDCLLFSLTTVDICEDTSLISGGFSDSVIRVWPLTSAKLCRIKSPDELSIIDKESGRPRLCLVLDSPHYSESILAGNSCVKSSF